MNTAMKNPKNIIESFELYAPKLATKEEFFVGGHRACQGCGEALAIRLMCKALGKDTVITNATGCMEVISSVYPTTAWNLPWIHVAFPNSAAVGSGTSTNFSVIFAPPGPAPSMLISTVLDLASRATSAQRDFIFISPNDMLYSDHVPMHAGDTEVTIPASLGPGHYQCFIYTSSGSTRFPAVIRDFEVT